MASTRRERLLASLASRPTLAATSSDFALNVSNSNASTSTDATSPLMLRFRRPSLLSTKTGYTAEPLIQSPLASAYNPPTREPSLRSDYESDKDAPMCTDSPSGSSSENATPPLGPPIDVDSIADGPSRLKSKRPRSPSTPPRLSAADGSAQHARHHLRRLSHPLKAPRLLSVLQESRPEESEYKMEAAFHRLATSLSDVPSPARTLRPPSDRGRYPEEAVADEPQRDDTPSDDGVDDNDSRYPGGEPISISKPVTPAHSVNGDEQYFGISESPSAGSVMDIDVYGSPSLSAAQATQWRYTPPPTANGPVRSNKRKFTDADRFEPYPTAKRRAVSPSLSSLRDPHSAYHNPRTPGSSRGPIPISIPTGNINSGLASPTMSQAALSFSVISGSRPVSVASSPTVRNMMLASPVLRPSSRYSRRGEEDERSVDGAGEGVSGLNIA
ncbi:hypothetical protein PUNSTDRAFT_110166 [Punctularia strigosozonata HHB-11173 SS5]|uniref:uncharacterized protein n=1 Tax=Punctularia strigosozonata (strain HHB-11173) TaxID=741275 RepID=UPI0004416875|nr:uncharacterized protein PUNSTDRAFT_110166 [Punctularia strigosozonata HHB-11173 SS5]EIN14027.1 hypothetical protein PUNSTDRAFT_110166 [Punctularia strigosozonata HHB-11173 SS5]